MKLNLHLDRSKLAGVVGALLTLSIGFFLLNCNFRLGRTLIRASYDWSFDLASFQNPELENSEVVIVYMDAESHAALRQPTDKAWARSLHAELLERLTKAGARVVVFDILFLGPGSDAQVDAALARAMQAQGKVRLAGDNPPSSPVSNEQLVIAANTLEPPYHMFLKAVAGWGQAQLRPDPDFIVREPFHGYRDDFPSLSWKVAQCLGVGIAQPADQEWRERSKERWVNYYGGPETIPYVSYSQALLDQGVKPGFFQNKVVFIGARPVTGSFIEKRDEFRSSYSTWHERFLFMPAVEVHATLLLNLLRGDWLTRLSPAAEWSILLVVSLFFGFGLSYLRPLPATGVALLGMLAVTTVAIYLFEHQKLWFPWMIVSVAQIPVAQFWHVLFRSVDWSVQKRKMEQERQQAEMQIHEQAALLDKAQDAIMVHDLAWRASYWNKSAEGLYGWTREEIRQQNLEEVLFNGDKSKLPEARQSVLEHGEWHGELHQKTRAGRGIIVESRWTLVHDQAGQPKDILVINSDVTEKKGLEAQFLRAQRMESIGILAGGIAHDLNNMLTPVIMGAELLRMKHRDPQTLTVLDAVHNSAKRGADLVKQVLTFSRGQEGEKMVLQLSHLIKEFEKMIRETFPKSIQVVSSIERNLSPVFGDATQLHQVLLNLLVNARDAMPDGGEIQMAAENILLTKESAGKIKDAVPGPYVLLRVSDTGTGISPEIIDRIFEPFFTTKGEGKGTGLGLSTVFSIVKGHQGFLPVKSEVGQGATFSVYLPASTTTSTLQKASSTPELLRGEGEMVLVVDDEQAIRDMTKAILTDQGYKVLTAIHGAEAVSICLQQKERIAVVVIDMMMPIMDGPSTIRAIHNLLPHVPFVAVSGLMQSDKIKEGIPTNNVTFLSKPFSAEKLQETLKRALGNIP